MSDISTLHSLRRHNATIEEFEDACDWHSIHISDSVQRIGDFAFHDAPCLEEVRLPDGIQGAPHAFQDCASPREISLLYTSEGKPHWQEYWFVTSEQGITMVTMDHLKENYLVLEGVTAQDVPDSILRKLPDLFPKGCDDHD